MKRTALLALFVVACGGAKVGPSMATPAREPQAKVSTIVPPPTMPARYLRSLEYDPAGYSAERAARKPASELLLGDLLFHSARTLGARALELGISCNTCHPNGAAHVTFELAALSDRPGNVDLSSDFFHAGSDNGVDDAINIPSLRGCRYTGPYGRDGRSASLRDFLNDVVHTEFGGATLSPRRSAALVRYVLELDFLPNKNLDPKNRLSQYASEAARRGAVLFEAPRAGFAGASCSSCHPASTFFRDGQAHRLGTGNSPSPSALDAGYETPTLLGLAETAPYFHDGRFAELADVVAWFDQAFELALSENERRDLTAYVEAVGAVDRPRDDRPLARRLDEVFSYVSLLPLGDAEISRAVYEEVAPLLAQAPARLSTRARAARQALASFAATNTASDSAVNSLRSELARLAADWAGALPPDASVP